MSRSNSPIYNPPQTGPVGDNYLIDRVPLDVVDIGFRKSQQGRANVGAPRYAFPISNIPNSSGSK